MVSKIRINKIDVLVSSQSEFAGVRAERDTFRMFSVPFPSEAKGGGLSTHFFLSLLCVGIYVNERQRPKVPFTVTTVNVNILRAALTYVPAGSLRAKLII